MNDKPKPGTKMTFEEWQKKNPPQKTVEGQVVEALHDIAAALGGAPVSSMAPIDMLADVMAFHLKMGIPQNKTVLKQKVAHLAEEFSELNKARNDVEALDAFIDVIYIILGIIYVRDWQDIFAEAWARVHEANMNKVPCPTGRKFVEKPEGWEPPDLSDLV